ncbi:MAG: DUF58 domain-containing protein [Verrucomicrobia bacterium]|nr:DUF58 domain-containing protein [Verrucomicrobiota bacterium]
MAKGHPDLLDADAISRAEALGLHARYIVEGYMAGEHRSPYRGFAIEFAQHREYAPGDDLRRLDWKVLGRTDRYYVKQYEQETNYVAHLLLDGSESMNYGSGKLTKLQYGKMLAAVLAYLILHQGDAVALGIFDETLRDYAPRSDNKSTIHSIMQRLAAFQGGAGTSIASLLHDMARQTRRKGIFILISDCLDDEQKILEGIQHLRFGGHEVILLHTLDPDELEFPFQGMVEFHGLEGIAPLQTQPANIRKSYLKELELFLKTLREGCERNQCHYLQVRINQPLQELLSGYLAFRLKTAR